MNPIPKAGYFVSLLILLLVGGALSSLLSYAPSLNPMQVVSDPYYWHVTQFSFYQATLSMLLSVGFAIPVAHALSRVHFRGKGLLLKLFSSTLVLPVLVGVFGLLAIYGNSGLLNRYFGWSYSIYGLNGILLAHVFFNLPYASRLLLQALETIPAEQHKLAAHLGMNSWQKFRFVEWPRMRQQLPHVAGLVFMLCFTSFATVMALGGGPKSTTIELAIFQAIKYDFDLQAGAMLALWQMGLCAAIALGVQKLAAPLASSSGGTIRPISKPSFAQSVWNWGWIAVAILVVVPPLVSVVLAGLNSKVFDVLAQPRFWQAFSTSLSIAVSASVLALVCGFLVLLTSRAHRVRGKNGFADKLELSSTIILVTPGLVVSTGLFLLLREHVDVSEIGHWVVIIVNALMALPYVIKTLSQPMLHLLQQYQYLAASLGIRGVNHIRVIEWRALRRPICHALALAFMLSMGDLSAIALFGSQDLQTLPLYLFQLLGSYQMEAAAVVSLLLFSLSILSFTLIERLLKGDR
ncbi:thiamine/thiamine pyrophosphate ABC transporter permease ThiP [Vibrio sp. SCSIO 43136]|uniref:thiamine/thiamine pyrophosphate ABC transporter permease ThiP n=1 Tax=Vibrio sp. SCSIO 43136 TaxID=2819101 RepID=UPI002074FE73|nr:thiamine/thiamine pyrophosphate ABC transporter permease ThiP [Vibrio sp. SCSIO 43136]USD64973.1 thiamine/thiamine pyrophosphate ABC transporter permease ThiP [Vibrio sp. SCSIO 43136]